jgi:hypothetical protein
MINCYWLRTTTVLDTDVKTLIKMLEQQWHLLEEGTCNSDESAVDFPARDLDEMTPFIHLFPFNDSDLGSSSLVAHVLPYPPPPPCKHLCTGSCSNKHTHSDKPIVLER